MTILGQRPAPVSTYDAVADRSAALVIRGYSTSFGTASRLLAQPVRSHVRNIYALVRIADEVVDSPDPVAAGDRGGELTVEDRADLLDRLEEETARALRRGRSSNL
ncbi:MAG TPA: squalene/phytoene synthase family protein, partial [Nocardioidaceae bacterium]|nr:squalene/phytoene synthase family protein [Nocardioidaceae bacterium]